MKDSFFHSFEMAPCDMLLRNGDSIVGDNNNISISRSDQELEYNDNVNAVLQIHE